MSAHEGSSVVGDSSVYRHASQLATLGFCVIPLHFVQRSDDTEMVGACSCGDAACTANAGKHPIGRWSNIVSADSALQDIERALGRYASCNLGLLTGKSRGAAPGLVAIDLDVKDDKNGIEAFDQWCTENGVAPDELETATAITGSGGRHLVFLHPENGLKISTRANILVDGGGIDVRGDGGYIVVEPSRHRSGREYEWLVTPSVRTLLPLPRPLLAALTAGSPSTSDPVGANPAQFTPTLDDLTDLATALADSKKARKTAVGKNLKKIVRGQPIAENGGGHDAYRDVLFEVGLRWPRADPRETIEHFRASVDARFRVRPGASCGMEDLLRSLVSAQAKGQAIENSWEGRLLRNKDGSPKGCEGNILLTLENHPGWKDVLAQNDRTQLTMLMQQPPIEACVGPYPRAITDADFTQIAKWSALEVTMAVSTSQCAKAVVAASQSVAYDPFKDWLESLPSWDGIERAETWLILCGGAIDSPYVRGVSVAWLLQAVYRTYEPGCQADYVLILQGAQGIRKSSLLRALVHDSSLFVDHLAPIKDKDARIGLQGPLIIELAELSELKRSGSQAMKAFLTTRTDKFRAPYGFADRYVPRTVIFCGSTNDDAYLNDPTGNRRYWPVSVTRCTPDVVAGYREQLWAELVVRYRRGELAYLSPALEALAASEQDARLEGDAWEGVIVPWLETGFAAAARARSPDHSVTHDQIFRNALAMDVCKWRKADQMRVSAILKQHGYLRIRVNGGSRYAKPVAL